ncbi:cuticle protein 18.6 [Galendromus occidentalis]|uniref:Cuticle protein 18.6 n=1 Tax=Galendromus occidentalis TaxID=34638 RepID=A0AAJ7L8L1_9ACAR|nr:cuticle protein 18.6 [Galendromus occidentalis]
MFAKIAIASAVAVAAAQATGLGYGASSYGAASYGAPSYGGYGQAIAAPAYGGYGHAAPLAYAAAAPVVAKAQIAYPPQPYKFGYDSVDEYGTKQSRHEVSDEYNNKKGSYSFSDAHGIARQVDYVADGHGFRASIKTNEPGTAPSAPAAAHYNAAPVAIKAVAAAPIIAYPPQPYKFGYDSVDEYGTKQSRHEVSDEHNNKKGSYSFTDARGISRHVEYVADGHGFRAQIKTNEPGTASSAPAAAHYDAHPIAIKAVAAAPVAAYAKAPIATYAKAPIATYAKAPVAYAAPIAHAAPVASYGHGSYGHGSYGHGHY